VPADARKQTIPLVTHKRFSMRNRGNMGFFKLASVTDPSKPGPYSYNW